MNLTLHAKHLGHEHYFWHAIRHDCDLVFHNATFWALIAFLAMAGVIIAMATYFGGESPIQGPLPTYPNIYWP